MKPGYKTQIADHKFMYCLVMEIDPPNADNDLAVLRAAILGDTLGSIARKTRLPQARVRESLGRLLKSKNIQRNPGNRYYFVTAYGEKMLSDYGIL